MNRLVKLIFRQRPFWAGRAHNRKFWAGLLFVLPFVLGTLVLSAVAACAPGPSAPTKIATSATPTATVTLTAEPQPTVTTTPVKNLVVVSDAADSKVSNYLPACIRRASVKVEGELHYYCVHHESWSFDADATSLAEIMPTRRELRDEMGRALSFHDDRCQLQNRCVAFLWYEHDGDQAYALPRVWPSALNDTPIAPVLTWNRLGDPTRLTSWEIELVDRDGGQVIQVISNPFVKFAKDESIVFDLDSGFFEIARGSADNFVPTGQHFGLQSIPVTPPAANLDELRFYGQYSSDDLAFLRESLDWLKLISLPWWEYVLSARPVNIYSNQAARFANSSCCHAYGRGRVEFPAAIPQAFWVGSTTAPNLEAKRVRLLSVMIHELTHVIDLRAGRFRDRSTVAGCVAPERAAVMKQFEFARDLQLLTLASDPVTARNYRVESDAMVRGFTELLADPLVGHQNCAER